MMMRTMMNPEVTPFMLGISGVVFLLGVGGFGWPRIARWIDWLWSHPQPMDIRVNQTVMIPATVL